MYCLPLSPSLPFDSLFVISPHGLSYGKGTFLLHGDNTKLVPLTNLSNYGIFYRHMVDVAQR